MESVCLHGRTSKGPQISSLKSSVDIVIETPGRLKDLIEMGMCWLTEVSFVVLDEVDRRLDMRFEPEVLLYIKPDMSYSPNGKVQCNMTSIDSSINLRIYDSQPS